MQTTFRLLGLLLLAALPALNACSSNDDDDNDDVVVNDDDDTSAPNFDLDPVYDVANGCYAVRFEGSGEMLTASGDGFSLGASPASSAARFRFRPADLGVYLLYDEAARYLTSDGAALGRQAELRSDTTADEDGKAVIQDRLVSEGEWLLLTAHSSDTYVLQHRASERYLSDAGGLEGINAAAVLELVVEEACSEFPELTVNASGAISKTTFEDGSVFGFVETHAHLFTNYAFGGGGVFHGSPYHRLGVEHALDDCTLVHGEGGRRDILGFAFGDLGDMSLEEFVPSLIAGELAFDTHSTSGYPDFTSWPDAHRSATHQMMYYKWVERAYLSGLRLMVQHATTNQVLCELATGIGSQSKRHDCNDMVNVDRIIEETYGLERYIDAQHGGPGKGWFRIVLSPSEAREVIEAGRMAVILGIETSDLFNCFLVPYGDFTRCTEADVLANLDHYHEKGVRVLFPVHKFDNGFSAGDGDRRIIDLGNVMHTGHYANFVECPEELLTFPGGFDNGGVMLGGLNKPRDVYDAPPPLDMSGFSEDPVNALLYDNPDLVTAILNSAPLEGQYCQNHGLTPLGEFLIHEMMRRGMILEVDHLPRKSYKRAFELLVENDYPAAGTHGRNYNGLLYELGGVSKTNLGRCRNSSESATMDNGFQSRIQLIRDKGGFPAEGFGFDLNGFAGAPGPRFGEHSVCGDSQTDEGITYPFTSYAGDITLERPVVGNRTLDFNTAGMVHLGLVAELIEDVRRDGTTDEELEPLFKSAEGYIRMWEKSEARGAALSAD